MNGGKKMMLRKIKGLKYPEEYFVKFFFKNGLHQRDNLRILEFGAGNGSNLMLPYEYGHEVCGVDFDASLIAFAKENFSLLEGGSQYHFICDDMREFAKIPSFSSADILSFPNIINYISKDDFLLFLKNCRKNKIYKKGAVLYIRFRTPNDFRYGYGKRVNAHSYRMDENDNFTGEAGALNCFYTESEMIEVLQKTLQLKKCQCFHVEFDNLCPGGDIIHNSDIVLWGEIH